jgi:membrane protein
MKISNLQAWRLLTKTVMSWSGDYATSMGAALAFYTMFSIAPLLLIVIAIAGYFFGAQAARGEILAQLSGLMGAEGARAIEALIVSASDPAHRKAVAGLGLVIFLIGATSVFNELQDSLNRIWRVDRRRAKGGFFSLVRARLLSFGMIMAIAFLLMVSLLVSAGLSAFGKAWGPASLEWEFLAQFLNVVISFVLITGMFAVIYKVIPQRPIRWRDVWVGAATTAMLFTIGKQLIGLYLGRSATVTAFGAVGSLAVCLLWVYYSAQIFLLGAEFTYVYSVTFPGREGLPPIESGGNRGGRDRTIQQPTSLDNP